MLKLQVILVPPSALKQKKQRSLGPQPTNWNGSVNSSPYILTKELGTSTPNSFQTPHYSTLVHPEEDRLRKFLHITKRDRSLIEIASEIGARFAKLYPDEDPLEILKLQDFQECDLDPDYTAGDVFDYDNSVRVILSNEIKSLEQEYQVTNKRRASNSFSYLNIPKRRAITRDNSIWSTDSRKSTPLSNEIFPERPPNKSAHDISIENSADISLPPPEEDATRYLDPKKHKPSGNASPLPPSSKRITSGMLVAPEPQLKDAAERTLQEQEINEKLNQRLIPSKKQFEAETEDEDERNDDESVAQEVLNRSTNKEDVQQVVEDMKRKVQLEAEKKAVHAKVVADKARTEQALKPIKAPIKAVSSFSESEHESDDEDDEDDGTEIKYKKEDILKIFEKGRVPAALKKLLNQQAFKKDIIPARTARAAALKANQKISTQESVSADSSSESLATTSVPEPDPAPVKETTAARKSSPQTVSEEEGEESEEEDEEEDEEIEEHDDLDEDDYLDEDEEDYEEEDEDEEAGGKGVKGEESDLIEEAAKVEVEQVVESEEKAKKVEVVEEEEKVLNSSKLMLAPVETPEVTGRPSVATKADVEKKLQEPQGTLEESEHDGDKSTEEEDDKSTEEEDDKSTEEEDESDNEKSNDDEEVGGEGDKQTEEAEKHIEQPTKPFPPQLSKSGAESTPHKIESKPLAKDAASQERYSPLTPKPPSWVTARSSIVRVPSPSNGNDPQGEKQPGEAEKHIEQPEKLFSSNLSKPGDEAIPQKIESKLHAEVAISQERYSPSIVRTPNPSISKDPAIRYNIELWPKEFTYEELPELKVTDEKLSDPNIPVEEKEEWLKKRKRLIYNAKRRQRRQQTRAERRANPANSTVGSSLIDSSQILPNSQDTLPLLSQHKPDSSYILPLPVISDEQALATRKQLEEARKKLDQQQLEARRYANSLSKKGKYKSEAIVKDSDEDEDDDGSDEEMVDAKEEVETGDDESVDGADETTIIHKPEESTLANESREKISTNDKATLEQRDEEEDSASGSGSGSDSGSDSDSEPSSDSEDKEEIENKKGRIVKTPRSTSQPSAPAGENLRKSLALKTLESDPKVSQSQPSTPSKALDERLPIRRSLKSRDSLSSLSDLKFRPPPEVQDSLTPRSERFSSSQPLPQKKEAASSDSEEDVSESDSGSSSAEDSDDDSDETVSDNELRGSQKFLSAKAAKNLVAGGAASKKARHSSAFASLVKDSSKY